MIEVIGFVVLAFGWFLLGLIVGQLTTRAQERTRKIARANRRMDFIHGDTQDRCAECGATAGGHTGYCSRSAMVRGDMSGYGKAPCPECGWTGGTHTTQCSRWRTMVKIKGLSN